MTYITKTAVVTETLRLDETRAYGTAQSFEGISTPW